MPRGSFLIMVPEDLEGIAPHFSLLRVSGVAPTPLTNSVQQTYFELHKKSMPELDRWTVSELQWGSIDCDLLGMFYPNPDDAKKIEFSGDINAVVSAHRYRVFSPDERILNIIINGMVKSELNQSIGKLRLTECRLPFNNAKSNLEDVAVQISLKDFLGARTAMFGKTRLGKSNVVKIIANATIEALSSQSEYKCGQLIFDINGEYANTNHQNKSLKEIHPSDCIVYALHQKTETDSRPLRLNFYTDPSEGIRVLGSLMQVESNIGGYAKSFAHIDLPTFDDIEAMGYGDKNRTYRKIQMFWAILKQANYKAKESDLIELLPPFSASGPRGFDPKFTDENREFAYRYVWDQEEHNEDEEFKVPASPKTLDELKRELIVFAKYVQSKGYDTNPLKSSSAKRDEIFDGDDLVLLTFLSPNTGRGTKWITEYKEYHDPNASSLVKGIIEDLNNSKTVILDMGSADEKIRKYFSNMISTAVFQEQERKFTSNNLNSHFVNLFFEEAHNLFPRTVKDNTDVYSRFAKEGAKFHIGMIYSTQSPSTISQELLAQTENFFVGHLSSQDEARSLGKVNVYYDGVQQDILSSKTPGYMRMLTQSHRFVVPVQVKHFGS
ncbi:ATP-binding protein [Acinetobacter higginsii]|uniref:ATP-binding protein n=1 Tax=Acinetobacter higginsii TaxID=70347 RepID=UPI001F4B720C|nr:DUF87 domain-containing protein [Acinetobacter higginsii]MCH7382181.1 DUF87 domain-containing protein [Acinetobacter higginsii]